MPWLQVAAVPVVPTAFVPDITAVMPGAAVGAAIGLVVLVTFDQLLVKAPLTACVRKYNLVPAPATVQL